MTSTIAVGELRVGMYILLEGGWLSHPFPLSAFRLASNAEIATLRSLGLQQVTWDPAKSDHDDLVAGTASDDRIGSSDSTGNPAVKAPPAAVDGDACSAPPTSRLDADRAAARLCERQHAEAAVAWRAAHDNAAAQPQIAGRAALALTSAIVDKMLGTSEVGIRLVNGGGDRSAAHAINVGVIGMLIGRAMGMDGDDLLDLGVGALMHDVGKQDLPDRLHHLDDGFVAAEVQGYREHVARGLKRARAMALPSGALAVIAEHHEHADGSGFPNRLGSERLSLGGRIVALVNRYDKLCNPATPTRALTPHEAVAMLFSQGRSRFDPAVLNAFIRMMGVYPAGSLVQLTDDRYALVMGVNSSRPLKPRVLVHAAHGGPSLVDLNQLSDVGIRRSLPAAKMPADVVAALDPRPRVTYYFEPLACEPRHEALAA